MECVIVLIMFWSQRFADCSGEWGKLEAWIKCMVRGSGASWKQEVSSRPQIAPPVAVTHSSSRQLKYLKTLSAQLLQLASVSESQLPQIWTKAWLKVYFYIKCCLNFSRLSVSLGLLVIKHHLVDPYLRWDGYTANRKCSSRSIILMPPFARNINEL